jgi:integrin alpha FG-GAP repeat containing protein 1
VKIGDINSDSYPDLLVALRDTQTQISRTIIFLNIFKPDTLNIKLSRSFEMNSTYILPPNNTYYSSFFDLDENGQLDVIIVSKTGDSYDIMGYYNNYIYDVFFLKSVTLLVKNFFVTNELGANYRYIATNLDGSRRMDVSFQGIQTSDLFLNLPYAFLGIGRSNNYIENFHVISNTHVHGQDNYKIFTPIIPNSQLIISKEFFLDTKPPHM